MAENVPGVGGMAGKAIKTAGSAPRALAEGEKGVVNSAKNAVGGVVGLHGGSDDGSADEDSETSVDVNASGPDPRPSGDVEYREPSSDADIEGYGDAGVGASGEGNDENNESSRNFSYESSKRFEYNSEVSH